MPDTSILNTAALSPLLPTDVLPIVRPGGAFGNRTTLADVLGLTQRRNLLVNGDARFARYGAAQTITTSWKYVFDRWLAVQPGAAGMSVSQVDGYGAGLGARHAWLFTQTSNAAGQLNFTQSLESIDAVRHQGKPVTLRFLVVKGSSWTAPNITASLYTGTGLDETAASIGSWTGSALAGQAVVVPTVAWQVFTLSANLGAGISQLGVVFQATPSGAAVDADSYLYLALVSITEGSVAPDAYPERSYDDELALCERWLPGWSSVGTQSWLPGYGIGQGSTAAALFLPFRRAARKSPTGIVVSNVGHVGVSDASGSVNGTNLTFNSASPEMGVVNFAAAASLVQYRPYGPYFNNAAGRLVFPGAEL